MQEPTARLPQSGELLVLADGRRFVVGEIQNGMRGWWFRATAQDGSSTLQGNLRLAWDPQLSGWRPTANHTPLPPSIRKASQPKQRQVD
jgi:hypothetical protein